MLIEPKNASYSTIVGFLLIKKECVSKIDEFTLLANVNLFCVKYGIKSSTESLRIIVQRYESFSPIWRFSSKRTQRNLHMILLQILHIWWKKILNFDDEQENKQTENSTNEQNTTFNEKFNKNSNQKTETLVFFVQQNSPYLTELQTNWNDLYPLFVGIQNILPFKEPTFISIENSIQNIKKYILKNSTKDDSYITKMIFFFFR